MTFLEKFITRKFVAATLTSGLMVASWVASQWLPGAREYLPGLFTGLVAALSAYTAGNVAQDHVLSKTAAVVDKAAKFVLPKPAKPAPQSPDEPRPE
jgi:hypothetical protein